MIEFNRVHMALTLVSAIAGATTSHAGTFDCRDISPTAADHQHVFQSLAEQVGIEPVAFRYCEYDSSPRWIARWVPFEELENNGEVWRRYATARCSDRNGDFTCHVTNHVVAGSSHVVVDIERCDISIAAIAGIHRAITQDYPGYEMHHIEFAVVRDGGAWSPSEYGYIVRLIEPPEFDDGPILGFVQHCTGDVCIWQDSGGTGRWFGGSTYLPSLRRERNDPMIEYIEP